MRAVGEAVSTGLRALEAAASVAVEEVEPSEGSETEPEYFLR